jgi:hypothetical protein
VDDVRGAVPWHERRTAAGIHLAVWTAVEKYKIGGLAITGDAMARPRRR